MAAIQARLEASATSGVSGDTSQRITGGTTTGGSRGVTLNFGGGEINGPSFQPGSWTWLLPVVLIVVGLIVVWKLRKS